MGRDSAENLLSALEDVQALLPADTGFAVGEHWTIADAAIAPFFARIEMSLKHDLGKFEAGEGVKAYKELFEGPRFERLRKYYADLTSRQSWKATYDEVRHRIIQTGPY